MKPPRQLENWASSAGVWRLMSLFLLLTLLCPIEGELMERESEEDQDATCVGSIEECVSGQESAHHKPRRRSATQSKSNVTPEFGPPIGNVSVVAGRDVRLVCTVDNLGQHQVAWLKEETKTILSIDTNIIITNYRIFLIPDEEGRKWVLHIKDVQESDRGFYRCQVNTNPMISTLGYLEVVVPPKIIDTDTTQTADVIEYANVSLQCKASGHPRPTISWRREDGEPIRLTGSGLVGQTSGFGDKDKRVSQAVLRSSSLEGGSEMDSFSDAEIRKRATRGPQQGATFSQLNDIRSDKLTLTNVDRTMAGLYVCSASNGIPSQVSRQIPLYVKFPPKVTIVQRPSVSVALGEQLELECLIEAFPKPSSYWSGRETAAAVSSKLSQVRFAPLPGGGTSAMRPRWLLDSGAAAQRQNKLDHRMQMFVGPPPPSGGTRALRQRRLDGKRRELASVELQTKTNDNDDPIERQPPVQMVHEQGLKQVAREPPADATVTVKQTPVNAYTYKLKLSVAQVRASDLGEYVCISSNSMGSSSARIQVRAKREPVQQNAESAASSSSSAVFMTSNDEREAEYQRDILSGEPSNSQMWANQLVQAPSAHGSTSGEIGARKQSPFARPNRVYDENYLQAIRSRQAASSGHMTHVGKLQTKFRSLSNSAYLHQATQVAWLWPLCALLFVATLTRGPLTTRT